MPHLVMENGPLAGQRLEVESELTIGRDGADVVLEDAKLSRKHAIFRVVAGGLEVEDLGSTNGTFVDGRRIDAPTLVKHGANVRLGESSFLAEIETPPATATETIVGDATVIDSPAVVPGATVIQPRAERGPAGPLPPADRAPVTEANRAPPPPATPAGAPLVPAPLVPAPLGAFAPAHARRGGLATRSWLPVALSFGTVLSVAVALVIYFAAR